MQEIFMPMGSTDLLRVIAERDCHLSFEKGVPFADRKRDAIWIKLRTGAISI